MEFPPTSGGDGERRAGEEGRRDLLTADADGGWGGSWGSPVSSGRRCAARLGNADRFWLSSMGWTAWRGKYVG